MSRKVLRKPASSSTISAPQPNTDGHPMEALLCKRDKIHCRPAHFTPHSDMPPKTYELALHFIRPCHIPWLPAHLVTLDAVIAYRAATADLTRNLRWAPLDLAQIKHYTTIAAAARAELHAKPLLDQYTDYTGRSAPYISGPEYGEAEPDVGVKCTAECCRDGERIDQFKHEERVIYRYMGEASAGLYLLEAIHFEVFMPDRLDLRFIIVSQTMAKKANLKECQLVWIQSSMLTVVTRPDRQRYKDYSKLFYPMRFSLIEQPELVQEDTESWTTSLSFLTKEGSGDPLPREDTSSFYGAASGQFLETIYCRDALFREAELDHSVVRSGTVVRRDAYWLYPVEPVRNWKLYSKVVEDAQSVTCQYGYRVDSISTEILEEERCLQRHRTGFDFHNKSIAECYRTLETSLSFGVSFAELDSQRSYADTQRDLALDGHLFEIDNPKLKVHTTTEVRSSTSIYANLYFSDNISGGVTYALEIEKWEVKKEEKMSVLSCRSNYYIGMLSHVLRTHKQIPCKVRFGSTPFHATHALVRSRSIDLPPRTVAPTILTSLYQFPFIPSDEGGTITKTKRSTRILATERGRQVAKLRPIRYATAYPSTSFAVLGEERSGKTEAAAAIAIAMPVRFKKVLIAANRANARALLNAFSDLRYADERKRAISKTSCKMASYYDDFKVLQNEEGMRAFFAWPEKDIVIVTVDTLIEMVYHEGLDHEEEAIQFIGNCHTMIIDTAHAISEAKCYILFSLFPSARFVFVGDPACALAREADQASLPAAVSPVLARIVKPECSLGIMQLPLVRNSQRANFFFPVPIDLVYYESMRNHLISAEMKALNEVIEVLTSLHVNVNNVVILTIDCEHTEIVKDYWTNEFQPKVYEFLKFEGRVRPIVIFLGGWYGLKYWLDDNFVNAFCRLHMDILISLCFRNYGKLKCWSLAEVKRVIVEKGLCSRLSNGRRM